MPKPLLPLQVEIPRLATLARNDTSVINVSDCVEEAKLRGIQCHTTQVGRHSPFVETPYEVMREPWFQSEHFIRRARRWAGRKG